jgi:ATPase subunit of ABC transporter with duplicated ATPase domains
LIVERGLLSLPPERRANVALVDTDSRTLDRILRYLYPLHACAKKWPEDAFVGFLVDFVYQVALAAKFKAAVGTDAVSVVRGFIPIVDPSVFRGEAGFRFAELAAMICSYEPALLSQGALRTDVDTGSGLSSRLWKLIETAEFRQVVEESGKLGWVEHPLIAARGLHWKRHRAASCSFKMISFSNINKQYGKQLLFVDASFQLNPGEKVGLVGPNGAGKTTLFRMVVGEETPDEGAVSVPKKLTIGYFRQDVEEMQGRSVLDEAIAGSGRVGDLHHELEALQREMSDPDKADDMDRILDRFGHVQEEYEHLGGYALESQAREVLHGLGFKDDQIDGDVGALSGGWKMRVALARVLLGMPDVLLMDEPTNHLDIESIIWLEQFLKSFPGALLMTSHDREFMNRLVSKIAEIDGGEIITYSGDYDFYERERAIRESNQQAAFARQQSMLAKEQRFIDRFRTHAAKAAQVQSRIKALDKIEKIELPKKRQVVKFDFRVPPRSGEQVAVLENLHKSYGPRVIYEGFNLTIRRGERWAVMGRNGAGKTTLLKMIAGASAPDAGSVRLGASLYMGYFAQQSLDVLNSDLTVAEQLQQDFPQDSIGALRNLAGAFQFSGEDVDKKIRALSGGEKSRLAIARMLYNPPNFLVLDEPTNHLDLATKEMLVDALKDFEGTMIFVSHDRMFLRGLGSRVLELGGESGTDRNPTVYPGSYVEYVQKLGHEAPGIYS